MTTRNVAKRTAMLVAAALLMGGSELTQAAQDLLALQITGVPGDPAFATANSLPPSSIQVLSASLGLSTAISFATGTGQLSKPKFADLAIYKAFNNSSPALALAEITGKLIPTAILSFYTGTPGAYTKYYTIVLTKAFVSSIGVSDSVGSGGANEAVTFAYQQVRFTDNLSGATECYNRATQALC